jgi:hypothetical protein
MKVISESILVASSSAASLSPSSRNSRVLSAGEILFSAGWLGIGEIGFWNF